MVPANLLEACEVEPAQDVQELDPGQGRRVIAQVPKSAATNTTTTTHAKAGGGRGEVRTRHENNNDLWGSSRDLHESLLGPLEALVQQRVEVLDVEPLLPGLRLLLALLLFLGGDSGLVLRLEGRKLEWGRGGRGSVSAKSATRAQGKRWEQEGSPVRACP